MSIVTVGKNLILGHTVKEQVTEAQKKMKIFNIADLKRSIDIIFDLVNEGKKAQSQHLSIEESKYYIRDIDTLALIDEIFDICHKYDEPYLLFTPRSKYITQNGLFCYYQKKLRKYNFVDEDVVDFWKTLAQANLASEMKRCMEKGQDNVWVSNGLINYCYKNRLFSTTNEFDDFIPVILKTGLIDFIMNSVTTDNLGLLKKIFGNKPEYQEVQDKYWQGDIVKRIRKNWNGKGLYCAIQLNKKDMAVYLYSILGFRAINSGCVSKEGYIPKIVKTIIDKNDYPLLVSLFQEMVNSANANKQTLELTQFEFSTFLKYVYEYLPNDEILITNLKNLYEYMPNKEIFTTIENDGLDLIERRDVIQCFINSIKNVKPVNEQVASYLNSLLPSLLEFRNKESHWQEQLARLVEILGNIRNNALTVLAADHKVDKVLTLEYRNSHTKKDK